MGLTGASAANLKMSLDKYCHTNLYTTEGFSIDWCGLSFENSGVTEWIQPRIIDSSSTFLRQSSAGNFGDMTDVLFQINIFVKKGYNSTSDRTYMIRDVIQKYFKTGEGIAFNDYVNAGASLGKIIIRESVTDIPLPETQEMYQYES